MTHYRVVIDITYDSAYPLPEDIETQLHDNVTRCVERENLLLDVEMQAVVDTYAHRVEYLGGRASSPLPSIVGDETWLQAERYAGPRGGLTRHGRAFMPDGRILSVRAGLPDTMMSIPAFVTDKGRRVRGYLTYENFVYRFHPEKD